MTNHLCSACLSLTAFGWDQVPCDSCAAIDAAVSVLTTHDCATLVAFGWDAPACATCESLVGAVATRRAALVA